jgi:hypothetical protein
MAIENKVVSFTAEANTKKYDAAVKKSLAAQAKHLKTNIKLTEGLDKETRAVGGDLHKYEAAVKKVFKTEQKRYEYLASRATVYMKEMLKAGKELQKRDVERQVGQIKEVKEAKRLLTIREAMADMHTRAETRKTDKLTETAGYGGHEMGEEMKDSLKEAMSSLSSRDFGGLAGSLMKAVGSAGKGLAGAATRASAGGGGPMGPMLAKIAPILKTIGSLAPMIGALSGALMAVVKIFLDADAAAKDFNQQVLATTGTAGFLAKNVGNADRAANEMKDTMKEMYDQATSLDNIGWGISKETHAQVEAALGAQGVQIDKTKEYFDEIKAGRVQNQGMVKDWGSMVQMSVGYSRAFGVSLQEVTDLQGELMSELGMGFDGVQQGFQEMVKGAEDAGIAGNKFFGQIRAISSDISLFNLRIGDAAKLMSKLDKAMSPRKAAEFFQTITKFFKGMGLMDRAKMVLMAGQGTTKGILKKDLDSRVDALAKDLDKLGDGVGDDLKKSLGNKSQLVKFLSKHDKDLSGEQRDAIMTASRQQQKIARGGIIDLASAMKDASPFAAMDEIEAMSKRMFGKPLEELSGVQVAAIEQAANINDEQLDQFSKLKETLDVQKETIAQKLDEGTKLTGEEADMMKKMGISFKAGEKDSDAGDKLRHADSKKVWDNMSKTQQDTLRDSAGTLDQAKRQGDLTQSLTDKLGVIMDFLMREVYNVLTTIEDAFFDVLDFLHIGDHEKRQFDKAQVKAAKTRDDRLIKAFQDAKGDMSKVGGGIAGAVGGDFMANLKSAGDDWKKLNEDIGKEQDPKKKEAIQKKIDDLAQKKAQDTWKVLGALSHDQTVSALQDAGRSDPKLKQIADIMGKADDAGGVQLSMDDALKQLNMSMSDLSSDEVNELLGKSLWAMTPDQLLDVVPALNFGKKAGAPAAPGVPAGAPTPDQPSAAQAAAAPSSAKPVTPDDTEKATEEQGKNIQGAVDDLRVNMKKQSSGIVLNGPYLKNQYGGQIEDSVYNAAAKALFEYFMYSDLQKEDVATALKNGINPRDFGASMVSELRKTDSDATLAGRGNIAKNIQSPAHADGGVVARPAPGEIFASVKPGERITPAGGGGGNVITLELKGDLKRIIRAEAHNAINEAQRAAPRR